ncbi:MAG: hypothetical protein RLZZ508_1225 [Actinomycetota bacterium]
MFSPFKWIRRILSAIISFVLVVLVGTAGFIYVQSSKNELNPSDAVIVLGAAQFDGTPTEVFANRLDHAFDLVKTGVAPRVITVGGKQPGDRFTEAQAGKKYLVSKGLKRSKIFAVPMGSDTYESIAAIALLMKMKNWKSVTVVSDPAHVARSKIIMQAFGFDAYSSPTQSGPGTEVSLDYLIRETGGTLQFLFLNTIGLADDLLG